MTAHHFPSQLLSLLLSLVLRHSNVPCFPVILSLEHRSSKPRVVGSNPTACVAECPENFGVGRVGDFAIAIILKRPDSLGLFAAWGSLECIQGFPVDQLSMSANMKSPSILLSIVAAVTMTFGL